MKSIIKYSIASIVALMMFWSCSKVSGHGSLTMILSGSVHGQLDPCG
ncbi:MAG: hypothetical protein VX651_01635 [Candidatus Neomarinimicrobiota bacterium]|nr:hypothetical protein [Candidatus Neomarinimicrobiota bacterium]MEC7736018.1 hypothetical protein [Candidatus Neomarinimicrobiota bacterium]MEE3153738.1 hypothetical protein [Candidatus Neomarinimicrobiota bacterium]